MNDQIAFMRADRAGGSPEPGKLRTIDFREVVRVLRRQMLTIFGTFVVIMVLAVIVVYQITPRYAAEALIMIDTRKTQVVDFQSVMSGLTADAAVIRSEVQVLTSRSLLGKVVEKLGLTNVPEFSLVSSGGGFLSVLNPINWLPTEWLAATGLGTSSKAQAGMPLEDLKLQHAVSFLFNRLSVINDGRSYVIHVRYEDQDPQLAARVANAIADLYLVEQLEAKFEATRRANEWLSQRIDELRNKTREADQAVQSYREAHKLEQNKGATVSEQQLSELNSQLVLARAERAQKEARLRQVQEALRKGGQGEATFEVLNSPLIQRLREQETDLHTKEAELSTRYGDQHPDIINARAQIRDLDRKIRDEMNKIVSSVSGEAEVARAREDALRQSLDQLQKKNSESTQAEVKLHELEREAAANQALFQNFLSRFKEVSSQEDFQKADARVISRAEVPNDPSYPRKGLVLALTSIFALGIGVVLAFLLERIDIGFRSSQQIELLTGIRGLGIIPAISSLNDAHGPSEEVLKHPMSSFSEAIRTIRAGLMLANSQDPPKTVLVTSSVPDEGKTSFAVAFARSAAASRQRVLLVDCDFRRASVAKMLNDDSGDDVLKVCYESESLENLVRVDEASGVHYLRAKSGMTNPPDLFAGSAFKTFLAEARRRYDLVVLDAPPVMAVSDALVLSGMVDSTMFLIRWGKTPRQVVLGGLKLFENIDRRSVNVVISRVNLRRHSLYGYGDYGYYYGRYHNYYYRSS